MSRHGAEDREGERSGGWAGTEMDMGQVKGDNDKWEGEKQEERQEQDREVEEPYEVVSNSRRRRRNRTQR